MKMRLAFPVWFLLIACLLQGGIPAFAAEDGEGVAQDRGTDETFKEDLKIETKAVDLIYDQFRVLIHVNVTSFNHNVLISGEVPDEAARTRIEKIVSGIEGVLNVNNELVISGNSSLASRSSDSLITTNVKLRLARDKQINTDHIKVVTENGTVFLMGNVARTEADAAADIASTTNRVKRVVKLFEYAD
jgi:osmotically-inducible protein OsmY